MDFFCFSTCSFFVHFIAFGLGPSGSGFDGFFFIFSSCSFFFPFSILKFPKKLIKFVFFFDSEGVFWGITAD